jgi:DNA polymerase IV
MAATAPRKIIHVDCDCFYAAIEMRDDPRLRDLPVAVGGSPDRRGVIATCNYAARKLGVRSAMASSRAVKLCPELVLVPPRFEAYREASRQIARIYQAYTPIIEPLSLDEAFLDVTGSPHLGGSATRIALAIRGRIRREVGITASAGVAPNKFLAKIASDWNKPDGQLVVTPAEVDAFVRDLPVGKLFGVGKVTEAKLHAFGLFTCADIRARSAVDIQRYCGSLGERLWRLAHGIDERPVESLGRRKSLSVETTYAVDLPNAAACTAELPALVTTLSERLSRVGPGYEVNRATFKMKFADFTQTTMECPLREPSLVALAVYERLCTQCFARGGKEVRLLGVGVRFADEATAVQQSLF